jgi:YD repeat-containing protein
VATVTNQLGKQVSSAYDGYGQATSVTAPSLAKTEYAYDRQERLRKVTDNADNVTPIGLIRTAMSQMSAPWVPMAKPITKAISTMTKPTI